MKNGKLIEKGFNYCNKELNKYNQVMSGECPICLDHMNKNDILGDWVHCFHKNCI